MAKAILAPYVLAQTWAEPEDGGTAGLYKLSASEVRKVKQVIAWIKKHSGGEWGHTIPSFHLSAVDINMWLCSCKR